MIAECTAPESAPWSSSKFLEVKIRGRGIEETTCLIPWCFLIFVRNVSWATKDIAK